MPAIHLWSRQDACYTSVVKKLIPILCKAASNKPHPSREESEFCATSCRIGITLPRNRPELKKSTF